MGLSPKYLVEEGYSILRDEGVIHLLYRGRMFSGRLFENFLERVRSLWPEKYYSLAESFYRRKYLFDTDEYESPVNPYKIMWVSPDRIERTTSNTIHLDYGKRFELFGGVREGSWDKKDDISLVPWRPEKYGDNRWMLRLGTSKEFESSFFYKAAEKHFLDDTRWENTEFYEEVLEGMEQGKPPFSPFGKNKSHFEEKLAEIDSLYTSVDDNGFGLQREFSSKSFFSILNDSILVDIGRDGELFFVEGRRRLTVAKILGVEKIPVRVLVRHKEWMEYRDRVYNGDLDEQHPDFKEFGKSD